MTLLKIKELIVEEIVLVISQMFHFHFAGRSLVCSNSDVVCSLFFPELEAEDCLRECVDGGVKILLVDPLDEDECLNKIWMFFCMEMV